MFNAFRLEVAQEINIRKNPELVRDIEDAVDALVELDEIEPIDDIVNNQNR
jgi:hypothetical protein